MRIKKHSPGKKTTSFRRLKLILLLAFNRPKEKDRKTFKDLVLEMIPIPTCVKCTPLFTLKLTKMCACDSKLKPEPTREDLVEIERQFDYLFNY